MLHACVRDLMDVVFSVCIVTRGGLGVYVGGYGGMVAKADSV